MRPKILLFLIPILMGVVAGCNVINPAEPVPTYIKIDSFQFKVNDPTKEGPASHGITSVWIYYNNSPVGAFDLPCNVPVITSGDKGEISVAPGISLNGLVDLQPIYSFYKFDTTTLITDPGKVRTFTPRAEYVDAAKFPYKEDFEVGNSFGAFVPGTVGDTAIRRTTQKEFVFSGGGAGYIELSANYPTSESISNTGVSIPAAVEAYLEINYKGTLPFEVGMYNTLDNGVDAFDYIWSVKASDTWKKMYIELSNYRGKYPGKDYKVLIKTSLPEGQTSGYVSLDNIKVVTF